MTNSSTKYLVSYKKLRQLMAEKGIKQYELAKAVGVSKFNMCRWCSSHRDRAARLPHIHKLATFFGVTPEEIMEPESRVGDITTFDITHLGEREWLDLYRTMTPLQQAKARLAVEEIMATPPRPSSRSAAVSAGRKPSFASRKCRTTAAL